MSVSQSKAHSTSLFEQEKQSSLTKYMRNQDMNFLYYITEQSVEDSDFDSLIYKEHKFNQQNKHSQECLNFIEDNKHELQNASSQKSFSFSKSMTPDQQFDKLLQITSRCIDYYNRFSEQKNYEFSIIQKTFNDLASNLGAAFQQIINEVQKKKDQIKNYMQLKHREIVQQKNSQDQKLKLTLEQIKSVHLSNLLAQKESLLASSKSGKQNNQSFEDKQKSLQLSIQLHNYATTLNKFYCLMEEIQTNNYKQMVQDCVNFINNLITQEIKSILYEKIPNKIQQKINKGLMNNCNSSQQTINIFQRLLQSTTKSLCSDSTDSLFKDININLRQIETKISQEQPISNKKKQILSQDNFNCQSEQRLKKIQEHNQKQQQQQIFNQNKNKKKKFIPKILDLNVNANSTPKKNNHNQSEIDKSNVKEKQKQLELSIQAISKTQQKRQTKISFYNQKFEMSQLKITPFLPFQSKKTYKSKTHPLKEKKQFNEKNQIQNNQMAQIGTMKKPQKKNYLQIINQPSNNKDKARQNRINQSIGKNNSKVNQSLLKNQNKMNQSLENKTNRSGSKNKSKQQSQSSRKMTVHKIIQI